MGLEIADAGARRFMPGLDPAINHPWGWEGRLEALTHRLRPEGAPLRFRFRGNPALTLLCTALAFLLFTLVHVSEIFFCGKKGDAFLGKEVS